MIHSLLKNPLLRDLARSLNRHDLMQALDALATEARCAGSGNGWQAWISRAFRLGVAEVSLKDLGGVDGRLLTENGSASIEIHSKRPRSRQLFTLAHEIAHLLLERRLPYLATSMKQRSLFHFDFDVAEESLANRLAATMLMPIESVSDMVAEFDISLSLFLALVREFEVSIEAAARRVAELSSRSFGIFRFQLSACKTHFELDSTAFWRAGFPFPSTESCRINVATVMEAIRRNRNFEIDLPVTRTDTEKFFAEARLEKCSGLLVLVLLPNPNCEPAPRNSRSCTS